MTLKLSVLSLINFINYYRWDSFPGALIQFDLLDFDFTLEMSRLCTYGVKIDCEDPKVISRDEQGREICFMVTERKNLVL